MNRDELILQITSALENLSSNELEKLHRIINRCRHPNEGVRRKGLSPYCNTCNNYMEGWFCPKSPDKMCYYYSEPTKVDGKFVIALRDGTSFPLGEFHLQDYETDDQCLFCGYPEERK